MTNSIQDITEESQCIFIIGSNTTEQHPVIGSKVRRAKRMRGAKLIVADPRRVDIADYADLYLRHKVGTDIALLNGIMHIILREGWHDADFIKQRTEKFEDFKAAVDQYPPDVASQITGVPSEDIEKAARMLAENRPGALLYAMGITQHIVGVSNVRSCANLQMLLGNMGIPGGGVNPLRGQNNVQGACDLGGLPNVYPSYQKVTDSTAQSKFQDAWGVSLPLEEGMKIPEILDAAEAGALHALYVIGENPMTSDPDLNHVRKVLQNIEFLIVQDIFFTETGQYADVILPAASFVEKEGTFTNTERRLQRVRKAIDSPGEAKPDSWIIVEIAKRLLALGAAKPDEAAPFGSWEHRTPSEVMTEINAVSPFYAGVTYERIEAGEQLQWPVLGLDHPGTPILHTGKFSRGLGQFHPADHVPPDELPDNEYPFLLTTGRVIYHWHGGEMTRRARGLQAAYPEALIEIHPRDAEKLGIRDGENMKVASRRGEIIAKAQVTDRTYKGLIFATFHYPESAANFLTNPAMDPIAKIPEFKACAVKIEAA
jgi:formate dehydrogenase alpha subunit